MFRKYILPILVGCIAGVIAFWAFDSFENQSTEYFGKAFLKTLLPSSIAVAVVNSRREKYL